LLTDVTDAALLTDVTDAASLTDETDAASVTDALFPSVVPEWMAVTTDILSILAPECFISK
jgi:hypothetical protein